MAHQSNEQHENAPPAEAAQKQTEKQDDNGRYAQQVIVPDCGVGMDLSCFGRVAHRLLLGARSRSRRSRMRRTGSPLWAQSTGTPSRPNVCRSYLKAHLNLSAVT